MCSILNFQTNKELSIVQFSTKQKNSFDYISLSQALTKDYIKITEIDENGDVNNLIVSNNSGKYVFIMDGDILEGAKQNRVLNTSVLLAPGSKTILPVSCVEQGRWQSVSDRFQETDYVAPTNLRKKKAKTVSVSLGRYQGHTANQSEVWNDVNIYQENYSSISETSNLSYVYEDNSDKFAEYLKYFSLNKNANGLAVFLRRNLLSIDVFNKAKIYAEYFPKLLKSVALEAYRLKTTNHNLNQYEASNKIFNFFNKLDEMKKNKYDGVGVGIEERFESEEFTGFSLNYKSHLIHLAGLQL